MNLEFLNQGMRMAHHGLLLVKKFSPEILTGVGVTGGVVAAVMASKATLELSDNVAEGKKLIARVKEVREEQDEEEYAPQVYQKDLAISYGVYIKGIIKTYALPVAVGAASVACILTAHGILRSRNAALTVAYNALSMAYKNYRERVREDLGEEKDYEYHTGLTQTTVSVKDEESGKNVKKKAFVKGSDHVPSGYARFFDEMNYNYNKNPELNLVFLRMQQQYANDRLRARGHVFLNEVYDSLGMERTKAGSVVGWVLSKEGPNFVDFGIYNGDSERARAFVNGDEPAILLDFNVDGIIYDKLGE